MSALKNGVLLRNKMKKTGKNMAQDNLAERMKRIFDMFHELFRISHFLWGLLRNRGYFVLDLCGFTGVEMTG